MHCTNCHTENRDGQKHCTRCGTSLATTPSAASGEALCGKCGKQLRPGSTFCTACGTPAAKQATKAENVSAPAPGPDSRPKIQTPTAEKPAPKVAPVPPPLPAQAAPAAPASASPPASTSRQPPLPVQNVPTPPPVPGRQDAPIPVPPRAKVADPVSPLEPPLPAPATQAAAESALKREPEPVAPAPQPSAKPAPEPARYAQAHVASAQSSAETTGVVNKVESGAGRDVPFSPPPPPKRPAGQAARGTEKPQTATGTPGRAEPRAQSSKFRGVPKAAAFGAAAVLVLGAGAYAGMQFWVNKPSEIHLPSASQATTPQDTVDARASNTPPLAPAESAAPVFAPQPMTAEAENSETPPPLDEAPAGELTASMEPAPAAQPAPPEIEPAPAESRPVQAKRESSQPKEPAVAVAGTRPERQVSRQRQAEPVVEEESPYDDPEYQRRKREELDELLNQYR